MGAKFVWGNYYFYTIKPSQTTEHENGKSFFKITAKSSEGESDICSTASWGASILSIIGHPTYQDLSPKRKLELCYMSEKLLNPFYENVNNDIFKNQLLYLIKTCWKKNCKYKNKKR